MKKLFFTIFILLTFFAVGYSGIIVPAKFQAFDSAGRPLSGGKLYTYIAGTATEKATYSDAELSTGNANPVVLDSRGEASIFGSGSYKFVLKDSDDVTIWTVDNVLIEGAIKADVWLGYVQRSNFTYSDSDQINLDPAAYDVNGTMVYWESQLTTTAIISGGTDWHYLYIDYSLIPSGGLIDNSDLYWGTTEPSWNASLRGYYHASNTDDRCIFAVLTNSDNIVEWNHDGGRYIQFDSRQADITDQNINDTWVDAEAALTMPSFSTKAVFYVQWENETTDNWYLAIRRNGSSSTNGYVFFYMGTAAANVGRGFHAIVYTDSSQLIEFKSSTSAADQIDAWTIGWYLPVGF